MAVMHSFAEIPQDPNYRTLILQEGNAIVYTHFAHPYDRPASDDAIKQLFTNTFKKLQNSKALWTSTDLPMVAFIGRYQRTWITKLPTGEISITDADQRPIDNYMGLE